MLCEKMETDKLRYFCTIAEIGSLTKAAEILGLSHGGLSKAVSALEVEVGCKLFRPYGRGLEITEEGKELYPKALDVLNGVAALRLKGKCETRPLTKIAVSEVIAVYCSRLIASALETDVSIAFFEYGELEARILKKEIDFGIAFIPSPHPELEYLKIGSIAFGAFARVDIAGKYKDTSIPFVIPIKETPANPLSYKHRDGWPHEVARKNGDMAGNFSIGMNLIKGGRGAGYMPKFVAQMENTILPLTDHLKELPQFKSANSERLVFLVKQKNVAENSAMKKTARIIRKFCCSKS